jgi:hypothetical protein
MFQPTPYRLKNSGNLSATVSVSDGPPLQPGAAEPQPALGGKGILKMSETTGLCCAAVWPLILLVILAISSIAVVGGAAGLVSDWKRRGKIWTLSLIALVVGLMPLLGYAATMIMPKPTPPTPEPVYRLTDEPVKPFLQAINQSNRLSFGFSPLPVDSQVTIQYYEYNSTAATFISIGPHTDWGSYTSWDVYFERKGDIYQWIGEKETYAGPHRYENIYIHYTTKQGWPYVTRRGDVPPNTLVVEYRGEDSRLTKPNLTLEDVRPILSEWKKTWEMFTPGK